MCCGRFKVKASKCLSQQLRHFYLNWRSGEVWLTTLVEKKHTICAKKEDNLCINYSEKHRFPPSAQLYVVRHFHRILYPVERANMFSPTHNLCSRQHNFSTAYDKMSVLNEHFLLPPKKSVHRKDKILSLIAQFLLPIGQNVRPERTFSPPTEEICSQEG